MVAQILHKQPRSNCNLQYKISEKLIFESNFLGEESCRVNFTPKTQLETEFSQNFNKRKRKFIDIG